MKVVVGIALVVAGVTLCPRAAQAQDARWEPWLGCWDLINENSRSGEGAARASALSGDPESGAIRGISPRVCVTRVPNGVTLTTTVPDQPPVEQTLIADDSPQPITEGGCAGSGRTQWSAGGDRLFLNAEVKCSDGRSRSVSGMGLIGPDNTWIDIRSFTVEGETTTRVSRYERAIDSQASRQTLPPAPMSLADVKEAAGKVSPAVLEAAIAETRPRLQVNRKTLADLAESGVPGNVTDIVVALAYPEKFVVERGPRYGGPGASGFYPFGIDDYYFTGRFFPAYYYSPFAYSYLGYYDPWYFRPIGVVPGGVGGGGSAEPQPSGTGRVVNGSGYTRIREADGATANPRGNRVPTSGDNTRSVSSGPANSGSSSAGSSSGDSGGSSTASPSGVTGGGGDTGRTAQPR